MKNKWRFFAVILAVVLCMTVFSVTAYAGGGDMVDSTMGDPTMETPTATTQPENTNTGEQTPNGQTLTVLVTENADGSHTVTIGDRSWTLPAKREQAGKVVNVRTYLNLRTGPGTDYTVIGRLLNGAEVKVLEESNGWYKVVVPEQTGYVCPRCGAEVTESKNGYFCERRSCKFGLWRDNRFLAAKKISLTKKMASSLLAQGRAYASGVYSEKTGKTYDAFILLEDDGARSSYKLDFTK